MKGISSVSTSCYLWQTEWSLFGCCDSGAWGSSHTPPPHRSLAAEPWGRRSGSTRAGCPAHWWNRAHFAPTPAEWVTQNGRCSNCKHELDIMNILLSSYFWSSRKNIFYMRITYKFFLLWCIFQLHSFFYLEWMKGTLTQWISMA